ncbi:MAG TPA: histidine kinase dimerization/phospho-acceptor domain-containing protein [Chthoniobacterales bacterium]|jgi:signal transduction histidine kinase
MLTKIFSKTGRKLQEMALTIDAFERNGRQAAGAIVENDQGKVLMDEIRTDIDAFVAQQETLLGKLNVNNRRVRTWSYWLSLITSVSGIVFLGILYVYTRRTLQQRAALLKAQRNAGERISRALEEKERAFNELTQVNRVKDEFLAIVSHELRRPLNAILGWATLLKEGASSEEYIEGLQSIERNARSQSLLIEDLLDVSRIVTGKIRLHIGDVDLREIARDVAESAKPSLEAKKITLEMRLMEGTPVVHGDKDRIQQVAWNLLSNAIKFTQKGGHIVLSVEQITRRWR